jgi:integrase
VVEFRRTIALCWPTKYAFRLSAANGECKPNNPADCTVQGRHCEPNVQCSQRQQLTWCGCQRNASTTRKTRLAYLSTDQLLRMLRAARDHGIREQAMFLFAVAHGARAAEIANLRLADSNLKQGTVHSARLKGSLDSTQNLLKVKGNPLFDEEKAFPNLAR